MKIEIKAKNFEYNERLGDLVQNYFSFFIKNGFYEDIDIINKEIIMNFVGFLGKCLYSKNTNLLKLNFYI